MDEKSRTADQMPATIGRYQVQASIGFGAMGAVYKAFDPLIKRTLAIKTIRLDIPKSSPQYKSFLERFYHEARISGTLSHPNIVTLFDIGEELDLPYLAMEFVEGETIGSIIEKGTKFDPERVIGLVSQIAAAVDYAHSRGVIHRDIKPSNLILSEGDRVKVTDFGIAKLADAEMTQSGALLGTPSYMSPEQAMGDKLDGRSDIFSLGICAFEMLSGEQPFPGTNVTSILYKLVHLPPVEPANLEMNGLVPQKWHEVFGRVLAKKPDDRYQTASAFVQDLELCLGSWFGSAMGEDGAPATVIMSASGAEASKPATPKAASDAPKAKAEAAKPVAAPTPATREPEPEPTVGMAIPKLPPQAPAPAAAKPAAPPKPAAPVLAAPSASADAEAATVFVKAPVVPSTPPPPKPSSPHPPPPPDAEAATVMVKAPVIPAAPPAPAKTPAPPVPPPAKAKAKTEPRPPAPPAPSPHTQPVARPADLGASTPVPPTSAPAAKSGGGALKLIAAGGVLFVMLIVVLGVGAFLLRNKFTGGGGGAVQPTAAPTIVATSEPVASASAAPPSTVVHVSSEPAGAMIFVDGEAKGLTPLDVSGIAMGSHEVRLDLDGYETKTQTVQLSANAPAADVKLTLAKAVEAPTTGTADITSTPPGAALTLDGRSSGTTPVRGLKLKPGTHRLELRKDGFEPYVGNVVVELGKRSKLSAALKAVAPKVTASPEPTKDVFDPNRVYDEGEVDQKPKKVSGPNSPNYPSNAPALKSGEKVSITVTWVVTQSGEVTDVKVTESGGKALDEAVTSMLGKQRWEPGVKKGTKVKVRLQRIYSFRSG